MIYSTKPPEIPPIERLKLRAYVACTRRRPALVAPFLEDQPHVLYYGPDDTFPPADFKLSPQWADLQRCLVGQFRAWNNQVAMAKMFLDTGEPIGLFMEDDTVPTVPDWTNVCNSCLPYMEDFDVLDLFADPMILDGCRVPFTYHESLAIGRRSLMTVEPRWGRPIMVWGCQAYYMSRKVALRLVHREYDGQPIDAYLPNFGAFAFLQPSPFKHDRSQGSMIDPLVGETKAQVFIKSKLTNNPRRGILSL